MSDRLPSLDELGREFERVARDPGRPRRRWLTALAITLGIGAVGAGVAIAASALLQGEPVSNPPGYTAAPSEGIGTPRSPSPGLLPLRIADPDGGPPWGLRLTRTSRSFGCVQIGRVVDGKLGVLGIDGAFNNDGRFHELPADVQGERFCQPSDATGRTFIAVSYRGLPSSGLGSGCTSERLSAATRRRLAKTRSRPLAAPLPACPPGHLRTVYFGLLGPRARSVSYDDERGVRRTVPSSGPEGAYLVVLRADRVARAGGGWVTAPSPGTGLRAVTYTDGHRCTIRNPRALGGARRCPRVGFVRRTIPAPDPAQLRAPVTLTVRSRVIPVLPGGDTAPPQTQLTVRFRAPEDADARSYYVVWTELQRRTRTCQGKLMSGPIARDIARGENIAHKIFLSTGCRGTVTITVRLHSDPDGNDQMPFIGGTPSDPLVGTATARLPQP